MAMTIEFEYEGKDYVLEYDRDALRTLERKYDFSPKKLEDWQVTQIPDLFRCAFLKNHADEKVTVIDEIWSLIDKGEGEDEDGIVTTLFEMYAEAVNSLIGTAERGKAISWKSGSSKKGKRS